MTLCFTTGKGVASTAALREEIAGPPGMDEFCSRWLSLLPGG